MSKFFSLDRLADGIPNAKVYEITDTGEVEISTVTIHAERNGISDVLTVDFLKGSTDDFSDYAGKKYVVRLKAQLNADVISNNIREFIRLNNRGGIPHSASLLRDGNVTDTSNVVGIQEPVNILNAEYFETNTIAGSRNQYSMRMRMPTSLNDVTHLEIMDALSPYLAISGVQLYDVTSGTREAVPSTDVTLSYELETLGPYAGRYVLRIKFIPENGSYDKYENKIYEVDYQIVSRSVIPVEFELRNIGYLIMDDVIAQTNENIVIAKGK